MALDCNPFDLDSGFASTVLEQLRLLHEKLSNVYVSQKKIELRVEQMKHDMSELRGPLSCPLQAKKPTSRLSSRRSSESSMLSAKAVSGPFRKNSNHSDCSVLLPTLLPHEFRNRPQHGQPNKYPLITSSCDDALLKEVEESVYTGREFKFIDLEIRENWLKQDKNPILGKKTSSRSIISDSQIKKIRALSKQHVSEPVFPLRPESELKLLFDAISMLVLLSDSIMVPYIIAWEKNLEGIAKILTSIALGFWTFDVVLNFATCFTEHDRCVTNWRRIACHYLKGWFPFDLFVLSFDWISLVVDMLADNDQMAPVWVKIVRLLKAGRMVRIVEMLRIGRFAHINEIVLQKARHLGAEANVRLMLRLFKMVALIVWMSHVGSCLWYRLMLKNMFQPDTCLMWSDHFNQVYSTEGQCSLQDSLLSERFHYLIGLYWSVTSMFSGSSYLTPTNSAEALFAISFVVFGMLFSSTVISSLAASLIDFQMMRREQTVKIATLQQYLNQHKIHPSLCVNVKRQIRERLMVERRLTDKDVPVISMLSSELRCQLRCGLCAPWLKSHQLFGTCCFLHDGFVKNMCNSCVAHLAMTPGEELFAVGTTIEHVYFMITGSLLYFVDGSYLSQNSEEYRNAELRDFGTVLGPKWVCEIAMWAKWHSIGSSEATDSCELLSIEVAGFIEAIASAPLIKMIMCDYAKALLEVISAEKPPDFSDMDLGVEHDFVVSLMNVRSLVALSQPALESLRGRMSERSDRSPRNIDKRNALSQPRKGLCDLEAEVNEGLCHLTHDVDGEVMRAVQVIALQLKHEDGRFLVQLGDWEDGNPRPRNDYFFPCTKRRSTEDSQMAANRLVSEEFFHPALQSRLNFSQLEIEVTASASYGIATKYVRTVFHGTIPRVLDANLETKTFHHPTLNGREVEVFVVEGIKSDAFSSVGGKSLSLCAWFTPYELNALIEYAGDKRLQLINQWMDKFTEPPESSTLLVGTATEGTAHGTRESSHPYFFSQSEI